MRRVSWLGASHRICSHLLNRRFQVLRVPFRERLKYKCTWSPMCSTFLAIAERQGFRSKMDGTHSCLWKPDPSCLHLTALRHQKASPDAMSWHHPHQPHCMYPPSPLYATTIPTICTHHTRYTYHTHLPLHCCPQLATSSQIPAGGNHKGTCLRAHKAEVLAAWVMA